MAHVKVKSSQPKEAESAGKYQTVNAPSPAAEELRKQTEHGSAGHHDGTDDAGSSWQLKFVLAVIAGGFLLILLKVIGIL
jgi:hypothetical protein